MGRWAFTEGADELFVVESQPDGTVSMHLLSPRLVVTREQAEKIRTLIGAAIAETPGGRA